MRALAGLLLILVAASPPARAEDVWSKLSPGGEATVVAVVDGDTVVIEPALDGMAEVRLVGIQAPKLPLGREGFAKWPLADEARDALVTLTAGKRVTLHYGGRRADRHGRHLAHLRLEDDTWVQGLLLGDGWARVYGFPDNRALLPEMLAIESAAREAGAGIWAHANYRVRSPDDLETLIGRFEIVEGQVTTAQIVNGTLYLNFGSDWRTDFTLRARPDALARFEAAGIDPLGYDGRAVRTRGWLKSFNGPMIDVTHPEQIEVLP